MSERVFIPRDEVVTTLEHLHSQLKSLQKQVINEDLWMIQAGLELDMDYLEGKIPKVNGKFIETK